MLSSFPNFYGNRKYQRITHQWESIAVWLTAYTYWNVQRDITIRRALRIMSARRVRHVSCIPSQKYNLHNVVTTQHWDTTFAKPRRISSATWRMTVNRDDVIGECKASVKNKVLSCHTETARCFVSLDISLSHSRSFKMTF